VCAHVIDPSRSVTFPLVLLSLICLFPFVFSPSPFFFFFFFFFFVSKVCWCLMGCYLFLFKKLILVFYHIIITYYYFFYFFRYLHSSLVYIHIYFLLPVFLIPVGCLVHSIHSPTDLTEPAQKPDRAKGPPWFRCSEQAEAAQQQKFPYHEGNK
jgi:hypothetical protein